jgi:O-acetyl-ADP-ribose deacetylase (regulator of RNase III)
MIKRLVIYLLILVSLVATISVIVYIVKRNHVSCSDCSDSKVCVNGKCITGCSSNTDCKETEFCDDGVCQSYIQINCQKDEECDPEKICTNGNCVPGCNAGRPCPKEYNCINGKCVHIECSKDSDCNTGYICKQGRCSQTSNPSKVVFAYGDITRPTTLYDSVSEHSSIRVNTDAVVNAANRGVCIGGGVTKALVGAVGGVCAWNSLKQSAVNSNGKRVKLYPDNGVLCPCNGALCCQGNQVLGVCESVIMPTTGNLANEVAYIISTPGPELSMKEADIPKTMLLCYKSILDIADSKDLKTIVCPFISSGIFAKGDETRKKDVILSSISAVKSLIGSSKVSQFIFIATNRKGDEDTATIAKSILPLIKAK